MNCEHLEGGAHSCCDEELAGLAERLESYLDSWVDAVGVDPEACMRAEAHPSGDGVALDLIDGEWECRYWIKRGAAKKLVEQMLDCF